jgi:hypothetical protein
MAAGEGAPAPPSSRQQAGAPRGAPPAGDAAQAGARGEGGGGGGCVVYANVL